jgi:hypothetical protein
MGDSRGLNEQTVLDIVSGSLGKGWEYSHGMPTLLLLRQNVVIC